MFYSHLQTMTGQPAVAGTAGNRLFDRPQRREPTMTTGHIHPTDGPLKPNNQDSSPIANGFRYIQRRM